MEPRRPLPSRAFPLLTAQPTAVRRSVAALLALSMAGLAAYLALKLAGVRSPAVDTWLSDAILLAACATCAARAVLVADERAVWVALASGLTLWTAGDIYWSVQIVGLDDPPFPSLADAGYLAFYPSAYLALGLLLRRHASRLPRSIWLDGAVSGLGIAALMSAIMLGPILAAGEGALAAVVTNAAYPVGDLVLLVAVAGIATLAGGSPGRAWLLIGGGIMLNAVTDTVFLYQIAQDTYVDGGLVEAGWPTAMTLLGLAAWQSPRHAQPRVESWAMLLAPGLFGASALGLLVYAHESEVSRLGVLLAAATIVAAGARTALTFREVQALAVTRRLALTDDLTGLGNRRALYLALSELDDRPAALLLIDLDRFKELNDTLGHRAGDRLLERIASRLQDALPAAGAVTRLGGDEFAVLLELEAADAKSALAAAHEVRRALELPLELSGITVRVEASVGIAIHPVHADTGEELLQRADQAMYDAKREHSGAAVWVAGGEEDARERLELFGQLRGAISGGELVLHYQPQRDLRTGRVTAVEALVRWQHPERGLLGPQHFVPLVEQTDLMRPLTRYVLDSALDQVAAWRREGIEIGVSVNVAIADLLDADFPASVGRALDRTGVPSGSLTLEITENVVMADPVRIGQVLEAVCSLGVDLSLDDFGTGYSSLAWLKRLPVSELKIDRSFVMTMGSDASDAAIVEATVDLARTLGLRVVAEGIEDAGTLATLVALGCDLAQGFHLSRPAPAADLEALLRSEPAALAVPAPQWQAALTV